MPRFVASEITLATEGDPQVVEAQVASGLFAVHRVLDGRGWRLSHAPTGVGLPVYARTERRIKEMAHRVMAHTTLRLVFSHTTRARVEAAGNKAGVTEDLIREVAYGYDDDE